MRYLIKWKSDITYYTFHNFFRNVIIPIKLVLNEDQNHYYYNILLKKYSYQLPKNNNNK